MNLFGARSYQLSQQTSIAKNRIREYKSGNEIGKSQTVETADDKKGQGAAICENHIFYSYNASMHFAYIHANTCKHPKNSPVQENPYTECHWSVGMNILHCKNENKWHHRTKNTSQIVASRMLGQRLTKRANKWMSEWASKTIWKKVCVQAWAHTFFLRVNIEVYRMDIVPIAEAKIIIQNIKCTWWENDDWHALIRTIATDSRVHYSPVLFSNEPSR